MADRFDCIMSWVVWFLVAFTALYFGVHVALAVQRGTYPPTGRDVPEVRCEDEPCWGCTTIGNRVCGLGATRPGR